MLWNVIIFSIVFVFGFSFLYSAIHVASKNSSTYPDPVLTAFKIIFMTIGLPFAFVFFFSYKLLSRKNDKSS